MSKPYSICFSDGNRALAHDIFHCRDLTGALCDLAPPRPVLVLVGGANSLNEDVAGQVFLMFRKSFVPMLEMLGAAVIDGGTDSGVMALMGRARAQAGASFPLIGIAARGTVRLPGEPPSPDHKGAPLEPTHTRFLLVPGDRWGDESPWMVAAASILAEDTPSATLAIGGGDVTRLDLELSLRAGRRTLLLAGSGGTAGVFARALHARKTGELSIPVDQVPLLGVVEAKSAGTRLGDLLRDPLSGWLA